MAQKEKSILTLHQREILELISKEEYFIQRFYLAGGTALAEFYLKHRISEDLDFFTEEKEVNPIPVTKLTDYPRMLKKIDHQEWKKFFLKEAKNLKKEIFK
ncbi:MAG: nucleotidyl transferase AbiEii/AbiGii toxin family protein [Patescibacteria group bacterium]|nr:nucleotidyl transferase AbiEii/AbiGii toxin family protein [Patescibacteria group bacterium]